MHPVFYFLNNILGKLLAAEDMEMKMPYALRAVLADVRYYSVAVCKSERGRNLGNCGEDSSDKISIFTVHLVCRCNMRLWNYETVYGGLRSYVEKRVAALVLVYLFRVNIALNDRTE